MFYLVFLLPPPTCGGSSGFDGGLAFNVRWLKASSCCRFSNQFEAVLFSYLRGGVEEERHADLWCRSRRRWSSDTEARAASSAAVVCLPTQMALWRPLSSPAVVSGDSSTSRRRPFAECEAALLVSSAPSGDVPGAGDDGCSQCSWCDGGDRGPDGVFHLIRRVISVNSRDLFDARPFCKVLTANVPVPLN